MKIITNPYIKAPMPPLVMLVGNLDGVHLGHRALIYGTVSRAEKLGAVPAVFSFYPHPREYFNKNGAFKQIFTREEKIGLLSETGIELYIEFPFTAALADMEADNFAELVFGRLNCCHLYVGDDFRFGRGREGDINLLRAEAGNRRLEVQAFPTLSHSEYGKVSSSCIRGLISAGNLEDAGELLGGPYFINYNKPGVRTPECLIHEFRADERKLLPPDGEYESETRVNGGVYPSTVRIKDRLISVTASGIPDVDVKGAFKVIFKARRTY